MRLQSKLRSFGARRAGRLARQAGFTLVEMLVVLAILGLVVGLVGPRVLNYLSDSKVKTAQIQMENLASALDLYYLDSGTLPDDRGRARRARAPPGQREFVERPLSQDRGRSQGPVGARLFIPSPGPNRPV